MTTNLKIFVANDYESLSKIGADIVFVELESKPDLVICAATGSSPLKMYGNLTTMLERYPNLFQHCKIVKLDEWGGLPLDHPSSCESFLKKHLLDPLKVDKSRYLSFASNPKNPAQEMDKVAQKLKLSGPIDLCILGLGLNGHLGFNEPSEKFSTGPFVSELSETTLEHPMLSQDKGVVKYGLTLGINNIMASKKVLLLVSGGNKSNILNQFLLSQNNIRPQLPASILWNHSDLTIICDEEALANTRMDSLDLEYTKC